MDSITCSSTLEIEACELFVENFCDMDIKNYVGQTAFGIAYSKILKKLTELKKKQEAVVKKDPWLISKQLAIPKKRYKVNMNNFANNFNDFLFYADYVFRLLQS